MSIGFRKSLLGFNQNDVIEYVKKLHDTFNNKEADLKKQISDLEGTVGSLLSQQEKLIAEKAQLNAKLQEFEAKRAEMERLSENIGKLYLVAQTNAKTIMSNAEENSQKANQEIARNVSAIETTHNALEEIKKSIIETSHNYSQEVAALVTSLEETKEKLSCDAKQNEEASQQFTTLLETVK